ncbi:MAG: flagellar M-ring protein FliF C-terminal domain-containing protein [bacterium]
MDPKALLQNRPALIGIIATIIIVIVLVVVMSSSKGTKDEAEVSPRIKEPIKLLTTSDAGKSLEIQSLLAQKRITVREAGKGSKIELWLYPEDNITEENRDDAITSIVRSGLIDKNVGLEVFDKGDFTSSREDKRIRLSRAINGELARLIKRLPNIKDASVFVSIPKDTIFTSMQQPTTATIQLVVDPVADKLDRNIIKSVINLIMGSVDDLKSENISITDTNGNVYSSVEDTSSNMLDIQEEKDNYMKKKINAQLDRLLGKGNYVVTVSTYLREVPLETAKITYNPQDSSVGNKQKFTEDLGDRSHDRSKMSSAVSSFLPGGLPSPESSQNRNYARNAEEYSYKVGQTQTTEIKRPGILEEISIAVTINQGSMPTDMNAAQLKELIARTANPKASAQNVEIAFADNINPYLANERPVQKPEPENSGNPWWTVAALLAGGLIIGLAFIGGKTKDASSKQQRELDNLLERTINQEKALQEAHQKTNQLQNMQQQMYQTLSTNQQQQPQAAIPDLNNTIQDIQDNIEENLDEKEFVTTLKSWIESSD